MDNLNQIKTEFSNLSDFLIAIGDEKRQAIIMALLAENACQGLRASELTSVTKLSRPAVSHHLKILREAHLVEYQRVGTKNYYYLSHQIKEIEQLQNLLTHISECINEGD